MAAIANQYPEIDWVGCNACPFLGPATARPNISYLLPSLSLIMIFGASLEGIKSNSGPSGILRSKETT